MAEAESDDSFNRAIECNPMSIIYIRDLFSKH